MFNKRIMMATLAAGLAFAGFGVSPSILEAAKPPESRIEVTQRKRVKQNRVRLRESFKFPGRKGDPGVRKKHTSRVKGQKRARAIAKRRRA